jgi:hypothetical protein
MSGFFQDLLRGAAGGFFGSDYLRDYTHASKTFRPNFYENTPKYKFLFHTYFEINEEIYNLGGFDRNQNLGLLVKEIKLPSYTFDTSQLNQYNRKRVVQTKIKYEPISITFHDDNASKVTQMWEAYYRYNYGDMDKGSNRRIDTNGFGEAGDGVSAGDDPTTRNIYQSSIIGENWGFNGDAYNNNNTKVPFFKSIFIYGMNRHNFTMYKLINPIITNFTHDTYNYEQSNGIMQNQMTIDYETVVYDYGAIDGTNPDNKVQGFGKEENYDRRLSPIATPGSNKTILGQGGLVDAAGGVIQGLQRGDLLGVISAARSAGTAYNTFKDVDLKETAKQELLNGVTSALTNPNTTRNLTNWVQQVGSTVSFTGTAGSLTSGANDNSQLDEGNNTGKQIQ